MECNDVYGLLTKSFFCAFMDQDRVEVHKLAKKRTRPVSSHLNRSSLVNEALIIGLSKQFFSRDTAGSPELARYMGYWPSLFGQNGWILAKFFFCVFMDRDAVEVHKHAKKERDQYPAILTEQACSIKELLYGFCGNFSCGTRAGSPKRAR